MAGTNEVTGAPLDGWEHVQQSLRTILRTPKGSRVMRRDFGSDVYEFIDKPMNEETMVGLVIAVAESIEPRIVNRRQYGEPRFVMTRAVFDRAGPDGVVEISLPGLHFPRGHLGDYSVVETATALISLR